MQALKENDIATMAARLPKKANKKQAFEALKRLIHSADNQNSDDQAALISELYSHFLPAETKISSKNALNDFYWLAQATANATRPNLAHIVSTGSELVATDGKILFMVEDNSYDDGFYNIEKQKLNLDLTFPNVKQVIPNYNSDNFICVHGMPDYTIEFEDNIKLYHFNLDGTIYKLNKSYIDMAIAGNESNFEMHFVRPSIDGAQNQTIAITMGNRLAVMMPMRGGK